MTPERIASRRCRCYRFAVEQDASTAGGDHAEQRATDAFLTCAAKTDKTDDLAGVNFTPDRTYRVDHDRFKHQTRRAKSLRGTSENLRRLPADDHQDRLVRRGFRQDALAGDAAVAQDNHPVSNLEHFVEPMRHVDHGDPARSQSAERGEQPRHLIRRQAGGGFVEHQDFSLGGERPGDRDKGFLGSAQALDPGIGVNVGAERFQRGGGPPACRGPIDQAVAARKTEGETDVLGDGHPIDQAEILMDEGDRQVPQRICHVGAAKGHSTLVECVDLGEDLDQSGLARAILAEQRQDFACLEIHADIAQGLRAAELLRDIAHDQDLVAARLDAGVPIGGVVLPPASIDVSSRPWARWPNIPRFRGNSSQLCQKLPASKPERGGLGPFSLSTAPPARAAKPSLNHPIAPAMKHK